MSSIVLTLFATTVSAVCPAARISAEVDAIRPAAVATVDLEALYRAAITFDEFYEDADRRRELWTSTYEQGAVAAEMVARVTALDGDWRILAVAEDWCSDSVSTIPYLALLAERASNLELRIIDSDVGREIMETHRTPDGRPATPTVLILDELYREVGCWVERPSELQEWALDARPRLRDNEFFSQKMSWYAEDGGSSTVSEIVEALEGAAAGSPVCAPNG